MARSLLLFISYFGRLITLANKLFIFKILKFKDKYTFFKKVSIKIKRVTIIFFFFQCSMFRLYQKWTVTRNYKLTNPHCKMHEQVLDIAGNLESSAFIQVFKFNGTDVFWFKSHPFVPCLSVEKTNIWSSLNGNINDTYLV